MGASKPTDGDRRLLGRVDLHASQKYLRGVDDLDAGAQPRCPVCGVLMRTVDHGDECPACGRREEWPTLPPKPLDDPAIVDFPGAR